MQKEAMAHPTTSGNATLTQANLCCMHRSAIPQRAAEVTILNIFHAGAALEKHTNLYCVLALLQVTGGTHPPTVLTL